MPETEVQADLAESTRERARREKRKNLLWTLIGLAVVLGCIVGYVGYWIKGWLDWDEKVRSPVTYTMPAGTQFIDQYSSPSDFFGDFIYCASFRLSESELDNLTSKGFDWIQAKSSVTATLGIPNWQTGRVPLEIPDSPCDNLKPWLNEAKTYRYLFAKGERNDWMRLLAIDEQEEIIFYFRGSW
jgi:hypothetical protein